jgi:AcrR family transcriptional regulator
MGRKSTDKVRIDDQSKKREWLTQLIPAFQNRGLKGFSMDEVARVLDVSKATVYRYFSSREEILQEMLVLKIEQISRFEQKLQDDRLSYMDRYVEALQMALAGMSNLSTRFLSDLKKLYPQVWEGVEQFLDHAVEQLRRFYAKGIEEGEFADLDPKVLALTDEIFLRQCNDPEWLETHGLSIEQAIGAYFRMKFAGIFPKMKGEQAEALSYRILTQIKA